MNQRIIYPNDDGGVSILIPAPNARKQVLVSEAVYESVFIPATEDTPEATEQKLVSPAVYRDETDEEFLTWIAQKDVPAGKPYKIVDVSDIPEDRTFRDAWEYQE